MLVICVVIGLASLSQVKADQFNSLTVTPQSSGSDMIYPGETAYYTVSLDGVGAQCSWTFTITESDLPEGATAIFTPNPLNSPSGTAILAITLPADATPDLYTFTVHCSDSWDGQPTGNSSPNNLTVKVALQLPEYPLAGLAAVFSCFGAFIIFKKRNLLPL